MKGVGGDAFRKLDEAIAALEVEARWYSDREPDEKLEWMRHLRLRQNRLELCFARPAGSLGADSVEGRLWQQTPVQSLRYDCQMASGPAAAAVAVGEQWDRLPGSRASVESGRIGFAALALIARTAEFIGDGFDESDLLKKAEKGPLLSVLAKQCMKARAMANPVLFEQQERELHQARFLEITKNAEDGAVFLRGLLDPEAGAHLQTAVDALAVRLPNDERTAGQRRADALTEMARLTLDDGHAPTQGGARPHVQVSATVALVENRPGAEPAVLNGETVISAAMFQRIANDSSVRRILLDEKSMVIDVGRERRLFSGATRIALEKRDGGCSVLGCPKPPRLCRGDHIKEWWRGGETTVENGRLLCLYHDRLRQDGWQLTRVIDPDDGKAGWIMSPPPWFDDGFPRLDDG